MGVGIQKMRWQYLLAMLVILLSFAGLAIDDARQKAEIEQLHSLSVPSGCYSDDIDPEHYSFSGSGDDI